MKKVLLGNTGINISRIGLGTVKFGRNQAVKYSEKFELPTDHAILDLLECAQVLGVNVLDTAPAYGSSEARLGKLLGAKRQQWIICTKVGEEFVDGKSYFDFSSAAIHLSIQRSLKRLNTDYLDIVLVHSNGEDKKIIQQNGVFDVLADIKKSGLIRAYGMSTKTVEGGLLTVDQADVVMVTYHAQYVEEKAVIERAYQKSKGVLIKKALASGHLSSQDDLDPVLAAMRFIFKEPGVSSVIIGTLNKLHLQQDVAGANQVIR